MRVLVVGGGGREHAIAWAISKDSRVETIYCAPGNAGTAALGKNVNISASSIDELLDFALLNDVDFAVVGPEAPLCDGIVDVFQERGLRIFGPNRNAARIEGSKAFAKRFLTRWGIPTAQGREFDGIRDAVNSIERLIYPVVIKADGLAAGKGVIIVHDVEEARNVLHSMMVDRAFGGAGERVVIEEYLEGEEASILAITDGDRYHCLAPSQDHKRALDGDRGPNTGGMGAYAPAPVITETMMTRIKEQILVPTIQGMRDDGNPYRGVLYVGLMIADDDPKVLEFNCRFGDPETQAVLPIYGGRLLEVMEAAAEGQLPDVPEVAAPTRSAACVVLTSGGYPGNYEKGKVIHGLDRIEGDDVLIFHAGTKTQDGQIVSSGGRVLNVVGLGDKLEDAVHRAYQCAGTITFEEMFYRKDIAHRALRRSVP
jgi:phosphoribosylamine--glycine ligase